MGARRWMARGIRACAALLLLCAPGCTPLRFWAAPREENEATFRVTFTFTAEGNTPWARVVALVPRTIHGRQAIEDLQCSPVPLRVFEVGENTYAEFLFSKPPRKFEVQIAGRARMRRYDLSQARGSARAFESGDLTPYLIAEPNLEKDDPAIASAASGIHGGDELDTVRKAYDFVKSHMTYSGFDPSAQGGGAVRALQKQKGDCTDYADLMVALCRAKGIPARTILGLYASPSAAVPQHSWVEAHLHGYGWVPFDPTADDCARNATFERLKPVYVRFSTLRNDEMLDNYNAYAMFRWWGDRITLSERFEVR